MFSWFDSVQGALVRIAHFRNHRIDLVDKMMRPLHTVFYPDELTAGQLYTEQMNGMLAEKQIDPLTSKRAPSVLFSAEKNGSLRSCVGFRTFKVVTVRYL